MRHSHRLKILLIPVNVYRTRMHIGSRVLLIHYTNANCVNISYSNRLITNVNGITVDSLMASVCVYDTHLIRLQCLYQIVNIYCSLLQCIEYEILFSFRIRSNNFCCCENSLKYKIYTYYMYLLMEIENEKHF